MSATEVIELIKKLPPEEQAEVRAFIVGQSVSSAPVSGSESLTPAERAMAIGRAYIERHPELFRRLAQ